MSKNLPHFCARKKQVQSMWGERYSLPSKELGGDVGDKFSRIGSQAYINYCMDNS